jgi:hypothetical protein
MGSANARRQPHSFKPDGAIGWQFDQMIYLCIGRQMLPVGLPAGLRETENVSSRGRDLVDCQSTFSNVAIDREGTRKSSFSAEPTFRKWSTACALARKRPRGTASGSRTDRTARFVADDFRRFTTLPLPSTTSSPFVTEVEINTPTFDWLAGSATLDAITKDHQKSRTEIKADGRLCQHHRERTQDGIWSECWNT